MPRILILAATCITLFVNVGVAQRETPEQVAARIWDAVQAKDWNRAAGFMHPVALRQLRQLLDPVIMMDGVAADSLRWTIYGTVSRDSAAAATDSAVYVNLMRFSTSVKSALPGAIEGTHYSPLGNVAEGRDTVHVIGRVSLTMGGRPMSWIQVYSLMRFGATWRGLLEPNWSQFASALRAAVAPQQ